MISTDPKLELNPNGYYGLSAVSPAINAATSGYPAIADIAGVDDDSTIQFDISGQIRDAWKDIGSDELGSSGTVNRPLKLSDVGPSYLGGAGEPSPPNGAPILNSAVASGAARVDLGWTNYATNADGVRVLRCAGDKCNPTELVATLSPTSNSYSDTTAKGGTLYGYVVEAFNRLGIADSNAVYVTTPLPPPAAPVLAVQSPTKSSLTLAWSEDTASAPVTGFDILRCTGSGCLPTTVIASVGSSARSYLNSGLARRTTYTYRVRAKNGGGATLSNSAAGTTTN